MGHVGRVPIARAWTFLALILNYLGQGALALSHPEARANPSSSWSRR
jgi:KUP system potassium uptake protein